jgi:pyruvate dehydrogenase E2 component (dihydrolipoamide acetyltransferase)
MPTEILMPALSPSMEEGTLARWLVKEGDSVSAGDIIAEIETDKATMEFEAVDDGTLGRILVPDGSAGIAVNTPIAMLLEKGEQAPEIAPRPRTRGTRAEPPADTAPALAARGERIFASPLARRIAAGKGLDLAGITGSGPRGRIVKADVETACARPAQKEPGPAGTAEAAASASAGRHAPVARGPTADAVAAIYADREYTEIALDGMRRTLAARLTEAKQTVPHFYLRRDVRIDALLSLRSDLNTALAPRGLKLSVNDFIVKACALALQRVPAANAVWAGDRILQMAASDLAVAVAVEGGLRAPVLRDAQAKSLSALSTEMKDLASRARDRTLDPQDCQGGSFAISNLGMFGIESFDAIVNPPHGAALAVGAGVRRTVIQEDGTPGTATMMSLTLSVDHRVIDGALGATLLATIRDTIEMPIGMLA